MNTELGLTVKVNKIYTEEPERFKEAVAWGRGMLEGRRAHGKGAQRRRSTKRKKALLNGIGSVELERCGFV